MLCDWSYYNHIAGYSESIPLNKIRDCLEYSMYIKKNIFLYIMLKAKFLNI